MRMLRELLKPVALVMCILSQYAVFQAAFLDPAKDVRHRLLEALAMSGLAGVISLLGGWIFQDVGAAKIRSDMRLAKTLPVQMYCWCSAGMAVLFAVAWYIESNAAFESHVQY